MNKSLPDTPLFIVITPEQLQVIISAAVETAIVRAGVGPVKRDELREKYGPSIRLTDAATELGVSKRTLWNWIDAGVLPLPGRIGRHSVLPVEVISELQKQK